MRRVFLTSPWLPVEWVDAHGLAPRGVWSSGAIGRGPASAAGACAYANSLLELLAQEPEAAFVLSTHCDQLRRTFDAFPPSEQARTFLFNLPSCLGPVALEIYVSEMRRLGRFLVRLGGRPPSAERLLSAVTDRQHRRAQLAATVSSLPAFEWMRQVAAGFEECGPQPAVAPIKPGKPDVSPVPVAIVGGPMPSSQWPVLETIEKLGGRVVLNAVEPGERHLWAAAPDRAAKPGADLDALVSALARDYVDHTVDVHQRPNTRLYQWLDGHLRSRRVRGILLWHYTWCDLWRAEAQTMREAFKLPLLQLDADSQPGALPRSTGRIEAFLELLK